MGLGIGPNPQSPIPKNFEKTTIFKNNNINLKIISIIIIFIL